MTTPRFVTTLLVHALLAGAIAGGANAQAKYPAKTIEVVVPYAPGGGTDNLMRMIVGIIDENKWSPVPINVVNRAGGGGAIGYTYLIGKKGDSHVVAGATPMVVSGKIEGRLPGNHRDAMTIIMIMAIDELMLSVREESPFKTIDDFVKAAREKPGQLTVGGTATNTEDHIFTYLFEQAAKIKVKYVPFNSGGEVTTALMGGHIDAAVENPNEIVAQIEAKKARNLAIAATQAPRRCAGRAHLRRARLRVLLGAAARRGRTRGHVARGRQVVAGHAEEGRRVQEVAGAVHQAQPPHADRVGR